MLEQNGWLVYALGGAAIAAEWWSYAFQCGLRFRRWSALAALLWAAQYYGLGAETAALNMGMTAVRTLLSVQLERQAIRLLAACGFCLLFIVLTAASWQGWISLLPALAVINTTLALFYLHNLRMRQALLLSSLAWIGNDIFWQAWPALLAESVAMLINGRSIARMTAAQR